MRKTIFFMILMIFGLAACAAPKTPTAAPEPTRAPAVEPTRRVTSAPSATLAATSKPLPTLTRPPAATATLAPTHTPPPVTAWADAWLALTGKQVSGATVGRDESGPLAAVTDSSGTLNVIRWINGAWAKVWSTPESKIAKSNLLLTDLDGDRRLELIFSGKRLAIYKPAGAGYSLFWAGSEASSSSETHIIAADLNQDGRKEVVSLARAKPDASISRVTVFDVQPDNVVITGSLEIAAASAVALAAGELSAEKGLEILVGDANGQLVLLSSDAQGGKLKQLKTWNRIDDGGAVGYGLQIADLDRDGVMDVVRGSNGGKLSVYHVDSSLNLTTVAQITAGRLAYHLDLADVNRDGKLEIVLGRGEDGYAGMTAKDLMVEAYALQGKSLNRLWSLQTISQPRPTVLDLDGNGKLEVFVYSRTLLTFTILRP